ncbi:MAG: hypothetical protein K0S32_3719 [Bacteroidetes bacterium]|jgi:hypothetical protein|nr:hypothetical protein [Bacteroidota bacterium]
MKQLLLVLFLFLPALFFSQSPLGINYQGVARDQNGAVISNSLISLKFDILQNSSMIYSEQHLGISTGPSGVFTAVIGSKSALQFKNIDWAAKNILMQVSIDINGGNQFVAAGNLQPPQYVPYSMFAENVMASYSGNVLTIGAQSFTLSSPPATTVNITGTGIASVTGSANNFTIDVPAPTLSVSGNSIILTSGSVITTATISSSPNTNITSAGIVSLTTTGTNSFLIGVPSPTFTSAGPTSISGSYPNYIVTSSVTPNTNITSAGIVSLTTTGTNSFLIGAPSPTFAQVGPTSITGSYPNYTITSATAITPSITVTSSVAATPSVSSVGSSFNINIPAAANSWSLGGNAGTNPATNFIGTSDAQDFILKTSSVERVRIKSAGNIGIGTNAPTALLHVNGTTRLVDGTQGANKVLTSDASGNASWQNSSRNTGFGCSNPSSASQNIVTGLWILVDFFQEDFDDGNNFASNNYTAPSLGVYQFNASVNFSSFASGSTWLAIYKNGVLFRYVVNNNPSSIISNSMRISATLKLNAGDVIGIYMFNSTSSTVIVDSQACDFSGYRVY